MKYLRQIWTLAAVMLLVSVATGEDFYQLLGIGKQATTKDIRKAFKKIALKMHPDKNTEDPDAHDKFLKINRAYEVLKDEDLRKKYDLHGEDGLKEDGPSGRGYQSWNFYNSDFGIYDDDAEIITLNKNDFEQSVQNTDDIWFINYYSPQCSHCHDLAPTWREVASELEGVVRIGAVNCGDDWMLCRQQGIQSYPSLIMYPQREKYRGDRSTKQLVKYALKHVQVPVIELWQGNLESELQDEDKRVFPWLISFCGQGGDCLEKTSALKLAAMLKDLANVAVVDCHAKETVCKKLGVESGTYFFKEEEVEKGKGMAIDSLDAKEIVFAVLEQLPEVQILDRKTFKTIQQELRDDMDSSWLVHFVEGEVQDLELRKLPAIMHEIQVGRIDCTIMRSECNDLHIHKFPTFVVFKTGGSHEIYHGRQTAQDIAAFARDSAATPLEVLGPKDFPGRVVDDKDPWFVDFYAPWCPPCMRLLPEFRKASKEMGDRINFGTVDCTVHQGLCGKYNVHSYPTTIFFNQSIPHQYQGHHNMDSLIEFIEDTLKPPVTILDSTSFQKEVAEKSSDTIYLVDFYAPWCGPCQQLAPEWRKLAKMVASLPNIKVAQVDCEAHKSLCSKQQVKSYPNIRLYPTKSVNANIYHQFNGWFRDAPSIRAWAFEYLPSSVTVLNHQTFNSKVLTSTEPWLIDFYAPWCGHCQVFAPEFEKIAQSMKGVVHAGKVDCDNHQRLCQQAGIQSYPTVRLYKGSKSSTKSQSIYGEEIDSQDADYFISLLQKRFGHKKKVPKKDEL